jgi:NADPH:quinone reductase-like Zn-dependent oxidoreductase
MRAVMCGPYGPPERLAIREVERPTPREGEVLVAVHSTTVNRTDLATSTARRSSHAWPRACAGRGTRSSARSSPGASRRSGRR